MNPNIDKLPLQDMSAAADPNKSSAGALVNPVVAAERPMPNELSAAGSPSRPQASGAPPDPTMLASPNQTSANPQPQAPARDAVSQADNDDEAIEKECVAKARAIVERTSSDPFTQAKEISKVKAELMKRRYGKELKASEG